MARNAFIFGFLLIVVGVSGYLAAAAGEDGASPTALIPAFIGAIIAGCGALAAWKPGLRKHVMHVAALAALLGVLGPGVRLFLSLGEGASALALISNGATLLFSGTFLYLCVRSFTAARRNPQAG